MGYTTRFDGRIKFDRPLTVPEFRRLEKMCDYSAQDDGFLREFTDTPDTIPTSYLQWQPTEDGEGLEWNGAEKFYDYVHWLRWLIKHFFKPHSIVLSGALTYQGEEIGDVGRIEVRDNVVRQIKLEAVSLDKCPNCGHLLSPSE